MTDDDPTDPRTEFLEAAEGLPFLNDAEKANWAEDLRVHTLARLRDIYAEQIAEQIEAELSEGIVDMPGGEPVAPEPDEEVPTPADAGEASADASG